MATNKIATQETYLPLRLSLLAREKELTRLRDALNADRHTLPFLPVTKSYTFIDSQTNTSHTLLSLFNTHPQLIVYHAMFSPSDNQACSSCTFYLDHLPPFEHLHSHNTEYVVVSRAKPEQIAAYQSKMGWTDKFRWLSSYNTSFNYDYAVTLGTAETTSNEEAPPHNDTFNFRTETESRVKGDGGYTPGEYPGHSVFVKGGNVEEGGVGVGNKGEVYFSYGTYARGGEEMLGTLKLLDWTPLGRQDGKVMGGKGKVDGLGFKRRGEYTGEDLKGSVVAE